MKKMQITALALYSGGLDSTLACRVVAEQGIKVVAVKFVTPFFGYDLLLRKEDYIRTTKERSGIDVLLKDVTIPYLELLKKPAHGFGKYFNPCIDCKIFLLSEAKKMMPKLGASFLVTGEVVGQRPMSQRRDTLRVIERDSGCEGILVRPLCAKNLEPTQAERDGLIDREQLYAFSGRNRTPQMKLADQFGINDYPSPAGGCILADPILSARIQEYYKKNKRIVPDLSCPVDNCCDGRNCDPDTHRGHHTFFEKIKAGVGYAFGDLWQDIAKWFLFGLLLAGLITVLIPDDIFSRYLGPGLPAMLLMLMVGIPLYICATASTPIAAALILKGVSPGAALVFLLAGPATNMASLTVLVGTLGKRATVIYLSSIAVCSVLFGLIVDQIYAYWGISAQAMVGQASEVIPLWAQWTGALLVLLLSIKPLYGKIASRIKSKRRAALTGPPPVISDSEDFSGTPNCGPT